MSSRSRKLLNLVLGETNDLKKGDDPCPENVEESIDKVRDIAAATTEIDYDSRTGSSDPNESVMQTAREMENIFGNDILYDSDVSIPESIQPSQHYKRPPRILYDSDDGIPESIQPSQHYKRPPRYVSESESELFGGDFSDNDPSYKPFEQPFDSASSSCSVESLVTLEDLLGTSNKNIPQYMPYLEPGPSKQPEEVNPITSSDFISSIIIEVLNSVWSRVKSLNRWRTANPDTWKKNIARKRRAEGLPYVTNKKVRSSKIPKSVDCTRCIYKCTASFSLQDRERICRIYWNLNFIGKKNFILSHITIQPPKRVVVNRKRARPYTTKCFFDLEMNKRQVCQKFFTSTLNISASVIQDAVKHRDPLGFYANVKDPRGNSEPHNKTSIDRVKEVVDHINSFPKMEGHYIRKQSKRQFLDGSLSLPKMYALYFEKYKENAVSEITYRRIFSTHFNLSFFVPKKDQCQTCNKYNTAEGEKKITLEASFQEHINRKIACTNEKEKDKKRAEVDKNFISLSFDLQAILQIPSSMVGILYFVRKLTLYNLCIYESSLPNNGYCFAWSEINGKKGSAEIGSILLYYLEKCVPTNVTEVSLFSDTSSGQNRNQFVAAILLWAVNKINNLQVIEQKFLESGHSYMEADSMHSSIENEKRHTDVFCTSDWLNIFKRARSKGTYTVNKKKVKKSPYFVKEFKYYEFYDLKNLAVVMIKNKSKDDNGNQVNWLKIKRIKYVKHDTKIYFNYDMSENYLNFETKPQQKLAKTPQSRPRTREAIRRSNPNSVEPLPLEEKEINLPELKQLYDHPLPISMAKKKDLVSLCEKGVIPDEFHGWYKSLNCDTKIVDRIPDVAVSESNSEDGNTSEEG